MSSYIPVCIAVLFKKTENGTFFFMQTRKENGPLNGLLEFPGGKLEPHETAEECAQREFLEEVGVCIKDSTIYERIGPYKYDYSDRCVCIYAVLMRQDDIEIDEGAWVPFSLEFDETTWAGKVPEANLEIIKDITNHIKNHDLN